MDSSRHAKTIVFIHGLFQNPASWEKWVAYFEAKGYTCYTPAYPYHDGDPAELRKHIHPGLGRLTLGDVTDCLAAFIEKLPQKPVLIGHSMGGLAVQKLIGKNEGIAGVCIDSAPPKGVFSFKWNFIKANLPTVNPFMGNSVCLPSVKWVHHSFCNTMTREEAEIEYERFVVPESRNIPRSSIGKDGQIDFGKPHPPLLFIAGTEDRIIPASLNRKNLSAYTDKNSITDFKEFAGRTHYICGQPHWEEVAGYVNEWLAGRGFK